MVEETKTRKSKETENKASQQTQVFDCADKKCAVHGGIKTRGRIFEGEVISDKMQKTATIEWPRLFYLPKFGRYEKRRSRAKAHNPPCIGARIGDNVRIAECRPLAKTVKFAIIEKLAGAKNA